MAMMSPMMFGGPGASDNRATIITVILICYFPVYVFLFYWAMGWTFFKINPKILFLISFVFLTLAQYGIGYLGLLYSNLLGIRKSGYSISSDKVYYDGELIKNADSKSFQGLDYDLNNYAESSRKTYAKDKNKIYYEGKQLEVLNPNAFKRIDDTYYYTDGNLVFYNGKVIQGADGSSFKEIHIVGSHYSHYSKDKNHVYFKNKIIENADPNEIEILDHNYSKTKKFVFLEKTMIVDADPDSFEVLTFNFAKDKNNIYHEERPFFPSANPERFVLLRKDNHFFAKDDRSLYVLHTNPRKIDFIDVKTFKYLGDNYFLDKNKVYYIMPDDSENESRPIEGVDVESFLVKIDSLEKNGESYFYTALDNKNYYKNRKKLEL